MSRVRAYCSAVLRGNASLVAATLCVVTSGFVAGAAFGVPGFVHDLWEPVTFRYLAAFLLLPLPLVLLVGRLQVRGEDGRFLAGRRGWEVAWGRFRADFGNPTAGGRAALAGVAVALVINTYGSWKRAMPAVHPFTWDERLARLDRTLHLGVDPWRLLQPWLGVPSRTLFLDTVYYTWLPVTFAVMGWLVWSRHDRIRQRALLGVVFVWVGLGNVAATLFSSAGPCYYGHLVPGPDPFANLLEYLRASGKQVPLFAPGLQQTLWSLHLNRTGPLFTSISAMPSVHVAMPALYAMAGWERNRWLGLVFGVYTALILLATVHLGWHYAVDGYFSILAVWGFWRLARYVERRGVTPGPGQPAS